MDYNKFIINGNLNIPSTFLLNCHQQLKMNAIQPYHSFGYGKIASYVKTEFKALQTKNPKLLQLYRDNNIALGERTIGRVFAKENPRAQYILLDFLCYLTFNKRSLADVVLHDYISVDEFKFSTKIPSFGLEEIDCIISGEPYSGIRQGEIENTSEELNDKYPSYTEDSETPIKQVKSSSDKKTDDTVNELFAQGEKLFSGILSQTDKIDTLHCRIEEISNTIADIKDKIETQAPPQPHQAPAGFLASIKNIFSKNEKPKVNGDITFKVSLEKPNIYCVSRIQFDNDKKGHIASIHCWFKVEIYSQRPITIKKLSTVQTNGQQTITEYLPVRELTINEYCVKYSQPLKLPLYVPGYTLFTFYAFLEIAINADTQT